MKVHIRNSSFEISDRSWARFMKKVFVTPGCWYWTASVSKGKYGGYGNFRLNGSIHKSHRVAYQRLIGKIPGNLTLDHLCRIKNCVNPKHLEPMTDRENILRSNSASAVNAKKTHCIRGHIFDDKNTYMSKGKFGFLMRVCRECRKIWAYKYRKNCLKKKPARETNKRGRKS